METGRPVLDTFLDPTFREFLNGIDIKNESANKLVPSIHKTIDNQIQKSKTFSSSKTENAFKVFLLPQLINRSLSSDFIGGGTGSMNWSAPNAIVPVISRLAERIRFPGFETPLSQICWFFIGNVTLFITTIKRDASACDSFDDGSV